MGPKGMRTKTMERVHAAKTKLQQSNAASVPMMESPVAEQPELHDHNSTCVSGRISTDVLALYLDIYHHKMYPVWPVVNGSNLVERLEAGNSDLEAYLLAVSVCAATILQLQLTVGCDELPQPQAMVDEVEDIRHANRYRQQPTLDSLSISFFLHITQLHLGRRMASTLLLREATSMAHLLQLHSPAHYADLDYQQSQEDLRKVWLLYITEKAHSSQYDIPCTVNVPTGLPVLETAGQPFTLAAFVSLCQLFAHFEQAAANGQTHTVATLTSIENALQMVPALTQEDNALQRADLSVTKEWLRLSLWKMAVSNITMVTDASAGLQSMLFPVLVARDLMATMSQLSIDALEAHGPGMELKLFALATSVIDVLTCLPQSIVQASGHDPREQLVHLAEVLGSFRGGSGAVMPILQSRLADVGLDVPAVPRIIELGDDSNDSGDAHMSRSSGEVSNRNLEDFSTDWSYPPWNAALALDAASYLSIQGSILGA